ncbi:unnamed protein product [Microthlaspi erraticum]|uniref:Uncharacterized protein n=1 Tax=Microthlaspi erraticum TaxID=1685480 RepID=A0A6D2HPK7_9BRAS|nr:unnamed protein product [Microthlaspi erraticum]
MDAIEPPSFSLGFDFDAPSDPNSGLIRDDDDLEEPGLTVPDSEPELEPDFSSPVLKRLRRGIRNINKPSAKVDTNESLSFKEVRDDDDDDDDDIEQFSSPEVAAASTRNQFSSSSSKVSLHAYGALTKQPCTISQSREKRKRIDVPASTGSGVTSVAAPLFKSSSTTRSPLRKLQLLDSDPEDDYPSSTTKRKEPVTTMPCNGSLWNVLSPAASNSKYQTPAQRRFQLLDSDSDDDNRDLSGVTQSNHPQPSVAASKPKRKECIADLWKDFSPASTSSKIQTPSQRKIQLIISDSEDDQPSTNRDQPSVASISKRKQCSVDLWKDFSPVKISKIQTPALDDVCQDYFSSIKNKASTSNAAAAAQKANIAAASSSGLYKQTDEFLDLSLPCPPSHRFFLHSDPRIQNLVRKRLPNFLPLGILKGREEAVSLIDYMNQFSSKESSKPGEKTKSKATKTAAPKDASKRRVSASTGSAGHWFTSAEGKKVYISKSGQEFSGKSAYKCYKKETGGGFNKSRKKRKPKKKAKN